MIHIVSRGKHILAPLMTTYPIHEKYRTTFAAASTLRN